MRRTRFNVQGCLVDTNVWIAAVFPPHPFHASAMWLINAATATQPLIWCRSTEQSFLRLATTASVYRQFDVAGGRISNRVALAMLSNLRTMSYVVERAEPIGIVGLWHRIADVSSPSPRIWMDAYLAAWAIAADVPLATLDADFEAFRSFGLKLQLLA